MVRNRIMNITIWTFEINRDIQQVSHSLRCPGRTGAGRGLLEVVEGDLLPQRDFLHHDREAEELAAEGV